MQWRSATVFSAPVKRLGGATSVYESKDGGIVSHHPGGVESWTGEGAYLSSTALPEDMSAVCLNPDSAGEVYVGGACFVSRWLLGGQGPLVRVRDPRATVRFLAALPGGKVVSAGLGGVQAWDLGGRPFPRRDATASESEAACLWRGTLPRGVGDIQSLCTVPMPSGQVIVAAGGEQGGGVCLWDGKTGESLGLLWALDEEAGAGPGGGVAPRKRAPAASLLALPGGHLAVGGPGVVWLWNLGTWSLTASLVVSSPGSSSTSTASITPLLVASSSYSSAGGVLSPSKPGEVHPLSPRPPTLVSPRISTASAASSSTSSAVSSSSSSSSSSSTLGAGIFTSLGKLQGGEFLAASLDVGTPMGAIYTWSIAALIGSDGGGGESPHPLPAAPSSPFPSDAPIFTPTSVILPPSLGSVGPIGNNLRTTALLGLKGGSFISASPDGTLLLWASTAGAGAGAGASADTSAAVPSSATASTSLSPRAPILSPRTNTVTTSSVATSPMPASPSTPTPTPTSSSSSSSPRGGGGAFALDEQHSQCLPPAAVAAAVAAAESRVAHVFTARLVSAQAEAAEAIKAAVEDAVGGVLSSAGMRVAVAEGEVERVREELGRAVAVVAELREAAAAATGVGDREWEWQKERVVALEGALQGAIARAQEAEGALEKERGEYEGERAEVQARLSSAFEAGAESVKVVMEERVAAALVRAEAAEGELSRTRSQLTFTLQEYAEKLGVSQTLLMDASEHFRESEVRAAIKDADLSSLMAELENFKVRLAAASAAASEARATAAALAYRAPTPPVPVPESTAVIADAVPEAGSETAAPPVVPDAVTVVVVDHPAATAAPQHPPSARTARDPFDESNAYRIILPRKKEASAGPKNSNACCTIA